MPTPVGSHGVPGQPNRVQLRNGDIVTRAHARSLGAREMGYKSEYDRSKNHKGDDKYFNAFVRKEQGKQALRAAKALGQRRDDLKIKLIAARNARPHGGKSGGRAYVDFMETYDLIDMEPIDMGDTP